MNKFKVDEVVLLNVLKDKNGKIVGSTSGLIKKVKKIDGRNIVDDFTVYYVEPEGRACEWINEIYLTKV